MADMHATRHPILAVMGACGGAGASVLCAALAASRSDPAPLLMDLDPTGGGIDVLLGVEDVPGARWGDLRLGGGQLDPDLLTDRLPSWGGVSVLAAGGSAPPSPAVAQVVAAARVVCPIVADVPRWSPSCADAVLAEADAAIIVVPSEVRAVVAAARLRGALQQDWPDGAGRRIAAVVRPGGVELSAVRAHLDLPAVMTLPVHGWLGGEDDGAMRRVVPPREIGDVATRMWAWVTGS